MCPITILYAALACVPGFAVNGLPSTNTPLAVLDFGSHIEHSFPSFFSVSPEMAADSRGTPRLPGLTPATRNISGNRPWNAGGNAGLTRDQSDAVSSNNSADQFVYKVTVQNLANKTVDLVCWDYVLVDPVSNKELARLRFKSRADIKPLHTKALEVYTNKPPTMTVSVRSLQKEGSLQPVESVEVISVNYIDGSAWDRR